MFIYVLFGQVLSGASLQFFTSRTLFNSFRNVLHSFVVFSADLKKFTSKHCVATTKIANNALQKSVKTQENKQMSTEAAAIKSKATTKITKLVLKPKPTPKTAPVTKMTTKYSTKPVTIKSRSTVSTMISHESTFRVQNIKKSSPNSKYGMKASAISVKSEQISHQLTMNTNYFDANPTIAAKKSFDLAHNEPTANITSFDLTKTINETPILQEITSAVVNGSSIVGKFTDDFEKVQKHENRPPKTNDHCDNDLNCQKRKYDVTKARKFIQTQREKWKESEKMKPKPAATKDEIKERLNALRKSTISIVAKNIKKARTNSAERTNRTNITSKKVNAAQVERPTAPSTSCNGKFGDFKVIL